MRNGPTNADDVIDSRDIIARINELRDDARDDDDNAELAALLALQSEAEDSAEDWQHGATLIRDSYFQRYAEQLADDTGALPKHLGWPLTCIDWKQAAEELQSDYTSVDFDGIDYWIC